jgi:hypothetical protein
LHLRSTGNRRKRGLHGGDGDGGDVARAFVAPFVYRAPGT